MSSLNVSLQSAFDAGLISRPNCVEACMSSTAQDLCSSIPGMIRDLAKVGLPSRFHQPLKNVVSLCQDTAGGLCFIGLPVAAASFVQGVQNCAKVATNPEQGFFSREFFWETVGTSASLADTGSLGMASYGFAAEKGVLQTNPWSGLTKLAAGLDTYSSVVNGAINCKDAAELYAELRRADSREADTTNLIRRPGNNIVFREAKQHKLKSLFMGVGKYLASGITGAAALFGVVLGGPILMTLSALFLFCTIFSFWYGHRAKTAAQEEITRSAMGAGINV